MLAKASPTPVDLLSCDAEPIHEPGTIQPFGFLVAVSSDWLISRISTNIERFIELAPDALLGKPLKNVFTMEAMHALRNMATRVRGPDALERLFGLLLLADGRLFDVAVHYSGSSLVIEAESAAEDTVDAAMVVRSMVVRMDRIADLTGFLREGARQVHALTGFDRVMVYRFDAAGSGEVVAEALRSGLDSFLGLNYPASDVPAQARVLYLRSVFRIIADIDAPAVPIIPTVDLLGEPFDQSLSILRAVSPIHLEYLRNMGVQASMSISIIVDGKLWGLFACHHYAPRLPGFALRSAAELFGRMFSMMLESRERQVAREYDIKARAVADHLMTSAARDSTRLTDAAWFGDIIHEAIPADGVGVFVNGQVVLNGLAPDAKQFGAIVDQLNQLPPRQIFSTDQIASKMPAAAAYSDVAAGMLAIPLSRSPRDYVVLFRTERVHSMRWAGKPEKAIEYGPNGPRLTPRKSFETWSELVRGSSLPFTPAELQVAEALRVALLEVVLQLSDAASRDLERAQEKQQLLVAELNHRVRNILSLIRGLISQTRDSSLSADAFVGTLDSRVQALARAHDQLTADRWGPARLVDLILTETQAYLGNKRDRIKLDGPNVLIDPTAFTALALVMHELVTNAAKYGSLLDGGCVYLSWRVGLDGSLLINWREAEGPPVAAPTRKGFGSTIIERSIPHDLGGRAQLSYPTTGFEAEFWIPSRFVGEILPDAVTPDVTPATHPLPMRPLEGCAVLVVEDSMLIALDCEDRLRDLGAQEVHTAPSVERALMLIEQQLDLSFAFLDYNLCGETSDAVAKKLVERNIPFAFATGYGDALSVDGAYRQVAVVGKPYDTAGLAAAVEAVGILVRQH